MHIKVIHEAIKHMCRPLQCTFLRALSDACNMASFLDNDLSLTLNAVILRENSDSFCLLASGSALRASCIL